MNQLRSTSGENVNWNYLVMLSLTGLIACNETEKEPQSDREGTDQNTVNPDGDEDGDYISNGDEGCANNTDSDGDGTPDYLDLDSDGDGIDDTDEAGDQDLETEPLDSDGDGTPDYLDLDSDNDGIDDIDEGGGDTDGDGIPDCADADSDGDGIEDSIEGSEDTDGDGTPDYLDLDCDNDGIADSDEGSEDTDGDGTPDYLDLDSDGDGISDEDVGSGDVDGDGILDCHDSDADGNGVDNATEGTEDTDGDGTPDFLDLDNDGDGDDDTTDCDDSDSSISSGSPETYYDGVDSDCSGGSDYDADGDGDDSDAWGGGDCDDNDPSITAYNCRPEANCVGGTHPPAATLEAFQTNGTTDLAFDETCGAYMVGTVGFPNVRVLYSPAYQLSVPGYANLNQKSIAINPNAPAGFSSAGTGWDAEFAVSHDSNTTLGLGIKFTSDQSVSHILYSTHLSGSDLWNNGFMNVGSNSIAWDTTGCIWMSNFTAAGSLDCMDSTGNATTPIVSGGRIESIALTPNEDLYISIGPEIFHVDTTTGFQTLYATASGDVLDMVFDFNNDLYVESNGVIELFPGNGYPSSTFQTVTGQGKLSISPDGWLVRVIPIPTQYATFEEWEL